MVNAAQIGQRIKSVAPWWAKIGIKLALSRLPIPYPAWRRLGLFLHGPMLDIAYAMHVFNMHYSRVRDFLPIPFITLELGPGDSLMTTLLATEQQCSRTYFVDVGDYVIRNMKPYNEVLGRLSLRTNPMRPFSSLEEVLTFTNSVFLAEGISSLKIIPDTSVDFVFSHSVLEHVKLNEFEETISNLFRLQTPGGVASHFIDLQDHLAYGLNSLRFPRDIWESKLFFSSGFYTNRLRASQIADIFRSLGYEILDLEVLKKWDTLPLPIEQLHKDFRNLSLEDLCTAWIHLVVRRPQTSR